MKKFYISEILSLGPVMTQIAREFQSQEEEKDFVLNAVKLYLREHPLQMSITDSRCLIFNQNYESFKIEEARRIIQESSMSADFSGTKKRVFVLLNFPTASIEAQNAILKNIEEAPEETLILLPLFSQQNLLGTIRSRCLEKTLSEKASRQLSEEFFQKNSPSEISFPKNMEEAFLLSGQYKKREDAINLIKILLQKEEGQTAEIRVQLLRAVTELERNFNPSLCLENAFLSFLNKRS